MVKQTLYSGGLIYDGLQQVLEGQAVLVENERIKEVSPVGDFQGFAGERVDFSGGTLLPGLIDCHVHLIYGGEGDPKSKVGGSKPGELVMRALDRAQESLRSGVTSLRDLGGKDFLEFAVRDACNSGRQLGPTILAAGQMICMTGGHGNAFGRVADGPSEVIKAVREQVHAGSDVIKIMATGGVMTPGVNPEDAHYSLEELTVGIHEGHRFNKTCASHAQGSEGVLNAVRAGIDSIEHGIFLTDECVEEMLAAGTYLVPTLSALLNIVENKDRGVPAFAVEKSLRIKDRHQESIKMFYKAGGKIAMGTDAGTPYNLHGANAGELRFMTDIGISNLDALKFSTSNAADLLTLKERGRIQKNCFADFLIVDGNPLENILQVSERKNHRMVVKNGKAVV
jgi:imidazolonepropionase-like amidohydrolase